MLSASFCCKQNTPEVSGAKPEMLFISLMVVTSMDSVGWGLLGGSLIYLLFWWYTGFELRVLCLLGRLSTT
jgi:hypothetical protein